tara:strand:+ start:18 stop:1388 length:1371 start_codon:yes stop_codon:yes gene_type:complete
MNVFERYKFLKINESPKYSNLNFREWSGKNLDIKLIKSTEIVNLVYRDTNKDLVLTVLSDIANVYKDYSLKDKESGINESIEYLQDQIANYTDRTEELSKKLYFFEKDNKLFSIQNKSNTLSNTENRRIGAENSLIEIKGLINLVDKADEANDLNQIYNLASIYPQFKEFLVIDARIAELNKNINKLNSAYFYETSEIKSLKSQKDQELNVLKNNFKRFLQSQKLIFEKIIKDNTRDSNILLKSYQMRNKLERDEKILKYLDQELQYQSLEQKKNRKPWELITNPTLLDYPVAPVKKRIVFIWTLFGLILSIIFALSLDKYNGLITKNDYIFKIFGYDPLFKINLKNYIPSTHFDNIKEIIDRAVPSKIINVLIIGEFDHKEEEELKNLFKTASSEIELNLIYQIEDIDISLLNLIIVSEFGQQYRKLRLTSQAINHNKVNKIPYLLIQKRIIEEI